MIDHSGLSDTIKKLRELMGKATPLPWYALDEHINTCPDQTGNWQDSQIAVLDDSEYISNPKKKQDGALITAMRNALPQLLAAAARTIPGGEFYERICKQQGMINSYEAQVTELEEKLAAALAALEAMRGERDHYLTQLAEIQSEYSAPSVLAEDIILAADRFSDRFSDDEQKKLKESRAPERLP